MKKNDSGFVCVNCGRQVEKLGVTSRNHCPYCLHSLHVDIVPGDRANTCKGLLRPIAIETNAKKIDKDKADELRKWMEEGNITTGINIDEDTKRYYPNNNLASLRY